MSIRTMGRIVLAAGVCAGCLSIRAGDPLGVRVLADRVNLRAKALATAEVVAQVSSNDLLTVRSWGEEWIEVVPPDHADLWVHRDLVKGTEVLTPNVNVRAGPGANYAVVGKVSPGDAIVPRGELGDWVKIAPPASATLWISTALVRVERPPEPVALAPAEPEPVVAAADPLPVTATEAAARPVAPETVTISLPAPAATPEPALTAGAEHVMVTTLLVSAAESESGRESGAEAIPAGFSLLPVAGQGAVKTHEGKLHMTGYVFRSPSRYRLATADGNTICYVNGNQNQLRSLLSRRMRVTGREYWVKGKDHPVLTVDRIVLVAEP